MCLCQKTGLPAQERFRAAVECEALQVGGAMHTIHPWLVIFAIACLSFGFSWVEFPTAAFRSSSAPPISIWPFCCLQLANKIKNIFCWDISYFGVRLFKGSIASLDLHRHFSNARNPDSGCCRCTGRICIAAATQKTSLDGELANKKHSTLNQVKRENFWQSLKCKCTKYGSTHHFWGSLHR